MCFKEKMEKNQFYGIKYPFSTEDSENYYVDLNSNLKDKVRSMLLHVVFTPKGQKIRDLEFGTNLIKYIFEPNDELTWGDVKNEIKDVVNKYIPNITVNDISVLDSEETKGKIYVRLDYTVSNGLTENKDSIITSI